ncbi:MAG: sugar phosphate isomerase/epimerase [Acidobacteriaceae bacterium]|nr:sugar phosphate isomerase/epimerase [Acidobacteriaceae bacterium]
MFLSRRSFLSGAAATAAWAAPSPWLLGANTAVQGYGLYPAIELVRQLEFPVIEIHPMGRPDPVPRTFPGFQFDQLDQAEKAKLRRALRPFRRITTHLPYTGLNWLSADAATRAHAVRTIDIALEGSAYLGARLAVLHPQSVTNEPWERREEECATAIGRWGERAGKLGVKLAVETGWPPSIASFVRLLEKVNHPAVGATIDVGHQGRYAELVEKVKTEDRAKPAAVAAYNDTTIEIIRKLGAKVVHLHVHDIDPATWVEHKPMVHGFVDYPRIFAALREVRYQGALVLEIGGDPERMPGYLREARDRFRGWLRT